MEVLSEDWDRDLIETARQNFDQHTRLWSFEVKLKLNDSNVRESYFQAVSNSSWANFAYLVAAEISGLHTENELRILSSLHGVGVIRLDPENVRESQIILPAVYRRTVDWGTANRLHSENADFREYLKLVRQFHQTGDTLDKLWN